MSADEERGNAQNPARETGARNERLVDEVRSALEAHDRRSEMESPDPATAADDPRERDVTRAAREEARRLREAGGRTDDDR